jgi:poly-gamma-glutamate synthesis protein (capsule biosynthesis protein)
MRRLLVVLTLMAFATPALAIPDIRPNIERPPSRPAPESFTIAFTGDTLIHMGVSRAASRHGQPYDFAPLFEGVRPVLSRADLAICHLEVPLDPTSASLSGFPLFSSPAEVADGLVSAGFDGCSTASNHSLDRGVQGIVDTIDVLEGAGLRQAGMARVEGEGKALYEVAGATVAHISATYSFNGLRLPEGSEWMAQLIDVPKIRREARRARTSGADLVVVSVHCCVEYQTMPTARQVEIYRELVESPFIDLVVSHHAHVVQPIERVGDEYIIYGLGNFISGQFFLPNTSDGLIAMVTARNEGSVWRFDEVAVVPTTVVRGSYLVRPAEPGSDSYRRTMETVGLLGAEVGVYSPPRQVSWRWGLE